MRKGAGAVAKQEPVSLLEFQARFATDEACQDHLFRVRWPDGFRCPHCGGDRYYWLRRRQLYQCAQCRYQASVTAGTIFHRSRIPLRKWFWAIFLFMNDKRGVSALQISRSLGVRYETAWFMLHKIRRAMERREEQYQLEGLVEMDDGYIGGVDHGRAGRGVRTPPVLVAVGVRKRRPTYAKMRVVERITKEAIAEFAHRACRRDAVIKTDGLSQYRVLDESGFTRLEVVTKRHPEGPGAFPFVHTLISNVKAWLIGTFHGGVRPKYLERYLQEFCYRFNRRSFGADGFSRLLQVCADTRPATYAELTG